ncbi:MAG: cobalamin biosynthesis protein CbiX [Acidobacteria bacterium]|nr:cobalamin biosynthesis protein CbiX [Acidobacteriota bacterium]
MTGLIVFAHGSSVPEANDSVRRVTGELRAAGGYENVETAFLEAAKPDLRGAVAKLTALGMRRIVVLPYFLTLGIHLRRDLPRIVAGLEADHPGVRIEVSEPLDGHPALVAILLDRARSAV